MQQAAEIDLLVELEDLGRRIWALKRRVALSIADGETWAREDFSRNTRTGVAGLPCSGTLEFGREAPGDNPVAPPHDLGVAHGNGPYPAHMCYDVSADEPPEEK